MPRAVFCELVLRSQCRLDLRKNLLAEDLVRRALQLSTARDSVRGLTRERLPEWTVDDVARLLKAAGASKRELEVAARVKLSGLIVSVATVETLATLGITRSVAQAFLEWCRRAVGEADGSAKVEQPAAYGDAAESMNSDHDGKVCEMSVRAGFEMTMRQQSDPPAPRHVSVRCRCRCIAQPC